MSGFEFSNNQKLLLCALIGLAAIGLSISHARRTGGADSTGVVLREPGGRVIASGSEPAPAPHPIAGEVTVHVTGSVRNPGLYSLPSDSRVADAVNAAGGASMDGDLQAINLAAKLQDGSQITVPARNPAPATSLQSQQASSPPVAASSQKASAKSSTGKLKTPGEGVVHINTANAEEFQRLPGVGPAMAQRILDHRAQIRAFTRPDQLSEVKGIGPKKWEKMRDFVAL